MDPIQALILLDNYLRELHLTREQHAVIQMQIGNVREAMNRKAATEG